MIINITQQLKHLYQIKNKQIMKIELYEVCDQLYLIPTIKTTYSRTLNGYYSIDLVWLGWGLSLMW